MLRGYQLTEKFVSFEKMTKQNGILFYVRPDYTSAIDSVTGFVSHFNFKDITNTKGRKDFFEKMESITYKNGYFVFTFDYRKYKPKVKDFKNIWTVCSSGKRILWNKETKEHTDYYPTTAISEAFAGRGITLDEGADVKALLSGIDDSISNADFYRILFEAFKRIVQLRNTNSNTGEDYIHSPAIQDGKQYCSLDELRKWKDNGESSIPSLPIDADANGAYHIALKGLYLMLNPQAKQIEIWLIHSKTVTLQVNGVRPQKISTCVDYCRDILLGHLGVRPQKISTCVDSDVVHVHHVVGVRPYKISTCVD